MVNAALVLTKQEATEFYIYFCDYNIIMLHTYSGIFGNWKNKSELFIMEPLNSTEVSVSLCLFIF